MANEITIVVKSKDRTDFKPLGQKIKKQVSDSVKGGLDGVEKNVEDKFTEIGDRSGKAMGDKLDDRLGTWSHEAGDKIKGPLKDSLEKATEEVDVKVTTKFREIGDKSGKSLGAGLRKGTEGIGRDVEGIAAKIRNAMSSAESSLGKAAKNMGGQGKLIAVAIINALAQLPAIASLAAGGITLALGGALVALALKAQSSNQQVRAAFSKTKEHVSSEWQKMTVPFRDSLLHMASDATHAFDSISPSLTRTLAKMAPAVTRFSGSFSGSLSKLNPAIDSLGTAFSRVLDFLGGRMPAIMNNFGTGIKAITDAAARNPGAVSGFVEGFSKVFRYLGDGIGILVRFKDQFSQLVNAVAGPGPVGFIKMLGGIGEAVGKLKSVFGGSLFGGFKDAVTGMAGATNDASKTLDKNAGSTQKLLTYQQIATGTTESLANALDKLTGKNQNAWDAQTRVNEALKAAAAQAKKSNAGFDGNSAAVNANREALSNLATTMKDQIANGHLTGKQVDDLHDKFVHFAEGMGASKKEAEGYAQKLLGVKDGMDKIPAKKTTKLDAKDGTAAGTKSAKTNLGQIKKTVRATLTATDKVAGAVNSAASKLHSWAHRLYRAQLTAGDKTMGAVRSAISRCVGFAKRAYRATLSAKNAVASALRSAISLGNQWAGRVFSATFNVIKSINPFGAAGMIAGGLAAGGPARGMASGGPGGTMALVGEQGAELVRLPTGSTVVPHGNTMQQLAQRGGGENRTVIELHSDGTRLMNLLIELLRIAINNKGGNVQAVLGSK